MSKSVIRSTEFPFLTTLTPNLHFLSATEMDSLLVMISLHRKDDSYLRIQKCKTSYKIRTLITLPSINVGAQAILNLDYEYEKISNWRPFQWISILRVNKIGELKPNKILGQPKEIISSSGFKCSRSFQIEEFSEGDVIAIAVEVFSHQTTGELFSLKISDCNNNKLIDLDDIINQNEEIVRMISKKSIAPPLENKNKIAFDVSAEEGNQSVSDYSSELSNKSYWDRLISNAILKNDSEIFNSDFRSKVGDLSFQEIYKFDYDQKIQNKKIMNMLRKVRIDLDDRISST